MKATFAIRWLLLALALPALPASAGPGALEIDNDCVAVGCFSGDSAGYPVTITQPGSYVLTSDLSAPGSGVDAIAIQTSAVDLDLNGHSIDGGGSCTGTPVTTCSGALGHDGINARVDASTPLAVHIHNGSIHGFSTDGVYLVAGDGALIDHVSSYENGCGVAITGTPSVKPTARIRDSALSRNYGPGVCGVSYEATIIVTGSSIMGNADAGILGTSRTVVTDDGIIDNASLGAYTNTLLIVGRDSFMGNNSGGNQYSAGGSSFSMGGNVCSDHNGGTCP